jgi:hypothetical protein
MIGALTITASAAAIGVNVPPGYVLEVDSQFTQGMSEICPTFVAGLNKNLALAVMYDTYFKNITVSGRYEIVKNFSADLYYRLDNSNSWMADLRGRYFFNQSLAVAGKYYYDSLFSSSSIYGQAEYMFNQHWMANAGLIYSSSPYSSTTSIVLGAGFGAGNIEFGFNYAAPVNDFSKPVIEVVAGFLIKK